MAFDFFVRAPTDTAGAANYIESTHKVLFFVRAPTKIPPRGTTKHNAQSSTDSAKVLSKNQAYRVGFLARLAPCAKKFPSPRVSARVFSR